MARRCDLTGKQGQYGNTVSNANNKARTKSFANLVWKRYFVPELNRFIRVRVSKRAVRTIDKLGGLLPAARKFNKSISPDLQKMVKTAAR
ncbi:MAG: 50S ribosomal protein L28 [Deltaproteobacteria bacterium CG11_big_fil_rev_8_21_14_0_20_45_16]|nr:MAG: 50S ribosomal protein L28 [Deltaproteobacteria bacterium CG11_big_fil_rev_8_21_14_0_20_45_16]